MYDHPIGVGGARWAGPNHNSQFSPVQSARPSPSGPNHNPVLCERLCLCSVLPPSGQSQVSVQHDPRELVRLSHGGFGGERSTREQMAATPGRWKRVDSHCAGSVRCGCAGVGGACSRDASRDGRGRGTGLRRECRLDWWGSMVRGVAGGEWSHVGGGRGAGGVGGLYA